MINININGKMRNWIFFAAMVMTIVIVLICYRIGNIQNQAYRSNYDEYQRAITLMKQQQWDRCLEILQNLDSDSQASYQVQYFKAICRCQNGDYNIAVQLFQGAQETRPALLQDQEFLLSFGKALFKLGDYERSKIYLQQSLKYPLNSASVQEAHQLLISISDVTGGQR